MISKKLKTNRNNDQKSFTGGFMATTAIVLLAMGSLAFMLVTMAGAVSYADSVEKREQRIQRELDSRACADSRMLAGIKDYFMTEPPAFAEFGCD